MKCFCLFSIGGPRRTRGRSFQRKADKPICECHALIPSKFLTEWCYSRDTEERSCTAIRRNGRAYIVRPIVGSFPRQDDPMSAPKRTRSENREDSLVNTSFAESFQSGFFAASCSYGKDRLKKCMIHSTQQKIVDFT